MNDISTNENMDAFGSLRSTQEYGAFELGDDDLQHIVGGGWLDKAWSGARWAGRTYVTVANIQIKAVGAAAALIASIASYNKASKG